MSADGWKKKPVWLCHQHNSFSFDPIFLKFADNVDMDGLSDEFETWPYQIICLRLMSPWLLKSAYICLYHQHNSFSFDLVILKLADKVDMDEVLDKLENCPDQIIYFSVTSTWLLKMPIFDLVIGTAPLVLIRSFWALHIRWGWNLVDS